MCYAIKKSWMVFIIDRIFEDLEFCVDVQLCTGVFLIFFSFKIYLCVDLEYFMCLLLEICLYLTYLLHFACAFVCMYVIVAWNYVLMTVQLPFTEHFFFPYHIYLGSFIVEKHGGIGFSVNNKYGL